MSHFRVTSIFLDEQTITIEEAGTPEKAAAKHIKNLPFDDGLDYPDDFWEVVVPIGEGHHSAVLTENCTDREWHWAPGEKLNWPLQITVTKV